MTDEEQSLYGVNQAPSAYAFPCVVPPACSDGQTSPFGLTKREWMVGMVATGFVANKERPHYFQPEDDAEWIVKLADLLLEKARG